MVKRYFIVFLILFFSLNVFSIDVKKYYNLTNKAEMAICHADYNLAKVLYNEAFTCLNEPFDKDYYNAFLCYFYTGDTVNAENLLKKLCQRKYNFRLLINCFSEDEQNKLLFDKMYHKYKNLPSSLNDYYDSAIDSILNIDQTIKKNYVISTGSRDYQTTLKEELKVIDSITLSSLKYFYNKYGFPGAGQIKLTICGAIGENFMVLRNILSNLDTNCKRKSMEFVNSIIDTALYQGKLHPFYYALLKDEIVSNVLCFIDPDYTSGKYFYFGLMNHEFNNIIYLHFHEDEKLVNKKREEVFLESIDEYREKILFEYYNKCKGFIFCSFNFKHFGLEEEFVEKIKRNSNDGMKNKNYYEHYKQYYIFE